jgi:hypothetical protein
MSEAPTVVVPCPACGRMGSGNYCSSCGADLRKPVKAIDPYLEFADGLINFRNIWHYLKLLTRIIPHPIVNTIRLYNELSFGDAIKFMEYSVTFYIFCNASTVAFRAITNRYLGNNLLGEIFSQALFLIYVGLSYYILLRLFYRFASKRYGSRNKKDYIKMYCLFAGFLLPLTALLNYVTGSVFSLNLSLFSAILSITAGILTMVYGYYVWGYFWKAPGPKVFSLLLVAFLISFVISSTTYLLIHAILNIDLPGAGAKY